MGNEVVDARLAYPADVAVRLLLHHVHGGLHNAALSLELAGELERGTTEQDDLRLVAQSGLEGIAQAARGVSLLTVLLGLAAGPGHSPPDHRWTALVDEVLRQRASDRGVESAIERERSASGAGAPDAAALVAALLDGIEAIDAAGQGTSTTLRQSSRFSSKIS